jgi:hypothetical protein
MRLSSQSDDVARRFLGDSARHSLYTTQREHDVRDVVLIRRAQKRGLLPKPTSDRPWLVPLFYVGFGGPQTLAKGWTRESVAYSVPSLVIWK